MANPVAFDPDLLYLFDRHHFPNAFRTWHYPGGVPAATARFLAPDDEVLAVEADGPPRAYPLRTIAAHHIVQDRIGATEVLVTF